MTIALDDVSLRKQELVIRSGIRIGVLMSKVGNIAASSKARFQMCSDCKQPSIIRGSGLDRIALSWAATMRQVASLDRKTKLPCGHMNTSSHCIQKVFHWFSLRIAGIPLLRPIRPIIVPTLAAASMGQLCALLSSIVAWQCIAIQWPIWAIAPIGTKWRGD